MKIGVDSSIIIAALHANHPLHAAAAQWLNNAFDNHEVLVAHHSVLESYAVLTRLPGEFRLSPAEARTALESTLRENAAVAEFSARDIWWIVANIGEAPASGGAAYDAFIIEVLRSANAEAVATFNASDFRRLSHSLPVLDPLA